MFDIIPMFLSSIASFLFPLFASYKALKTPDPAQLAPWLMYWSVLSCVVLAESWVGFLLVWVPFYAYLRLGFLLYLVLPQTQGARHLYEAYLYPYLEENEVAIEDFIASAHDRLKAAGIAYLKHAIELIRTRVFGLPPAAAAEAEQQRPDDKAASGAPQGYTQALLARFSVPAARWAANNAGSAGHDFYNLLAGAVGAAAGAGSGSGSSGYSYGGGYGTKSTDSSVTAKGGMSASASGTLIPDNIGGAQEKMTFIAAQRERLAFVLSALDREAQQLESSQQPAPPAPESSTGSGSGSNSGGNGSGYPSRPPSGHSVWSALSKSRSEVDFEKIDAESGAEEDEATTLRRRAQQSQQQQQQPQAPEPKAPWTFLGWGTVGSGPPADSSGRSSGVDS
ncbi:hypothetical protein SLS62_001540 [Diatrype stigma]|uniref:Protein YOP1 n=1 Tax=Diatrype stigma TaxID=117547 RepID=A0AAN9V839_9PEZI